MNKKTSGLTAAVLAAAVMGSPLESEASTGGPIGVNFRSGETYNERTARQERESMYTWLGFLTVVGVGLTLAEVSDRRRGYRFGMKMHSYEE